MAKPNGAPQPLSQMILYEINIAEIGGDLERVRRLMAYLKDLGVNSIEIMPLSNAGNSIDWGYLPIGYFGVDERFGKRSDFQAVVDVCHQHGIAVIIDVVYGHTGIDFPYYDAYTRLRYRENPFMGPFAKDYFSNFGKSTDFTRQLTRDYFFTVNHHWLDVYHVDGFRYDCVPNYWDGPSGWATPVLSMKLTSLPRRRSLKSIPTGSALQANAENHSGSCRWQSSSRIRRAFCTCPIPTALGRTVRLMRRVALHAAIAAGCSISGCHSGSSATQSKRTVTAT